MAEGNPRNEKSPMSLPLEWTTRLILRAPGLVFSAGVALALVSVLVALNGLTFKTSRLDLLSPRSEYNQRWLAYLDEFGNRDDAVVVIRSDDPKALTAAIDDLGYQLRERPDLFESVLDRLDFKDLKAKGLHFLPADELKKLAELSIQAAVMVPRQGAASDPVEAFQKCNDQWERIASESPDVRAQMERSYAQLAGRLLAVIASSPTQQPLAQASHARPLSDDDGQASYGELSSAAAAASAGMSTKLMAAMPQEAHRYLLSDDGSMGFVLLKLRPEKGEFSPGANAISILRKEIEEARGRNKSAWIGLTGMPVIEHDEMQVSQFDMTWTNVLSFIAVAALFVAGYGGVRHALLANIVLLLAIAYSFAFVTIAVGHLNILSSAFGAMLIGLGIDYGTYYIAYYLKLRSEGLPTEAALIRSMAEAGPGMVTGAVTTAAAFFMAGLTEFTGVRELGIVAGAGILLCIAATVLFLPPLVLLVDRRRADVHLPVILPAAKWFQGSIRWPRTVFLCGLTLTVALGSWIGDMRYDHNLLNLQPKHVESVDIERDLFTSQKDSVWFAVSVCPTRDELRRRKAMFEQLPMVAKTEEIITLLPESNSLKQQSIVTIGSAAAYLPDELPPLGPLRIGQLQRELRRAMQLLAGAPHESQAAGMLVQLSGALAQMPEQQAGPMLAARLTELSQKALGQLGQLRDVADPIPPRLEDLPSELTARYVGKNSQHLLKVYARGNIWDMDRLKQFVAEAEAVDPQITGHPVQTYYASRHMQQSFIHAGIYAFFAVLVILMLDFRSLRVSLLAMVPLGMGMAQMFGIMAWFDMPFNAANMIAIALVLGIGVDVGVHITHDYLRQKGRFKLSDATTMAVLLTESTTMASFGTMILARHQGLRSLGQVLTIGVTCCLASSIIAYPALLRWISSRRKGEEESSADLQAEQLELGSEPVDSFADDQITIHAPAIANVVPAPHITVPSRQPVFVPVAYEEFSADVASPDEFAVSDFETLPELRQPLAALPAGESPRRSVVVSDTIALLAESNARMVPRRRDSDE
jgi:hopanoid biosynthesis associated RND transporter like protein HpnN